MSPPPNPIDGNPNAASTLRRRQLWIGGISPASTQDDIMSCFILPSRPSTSIQMRHGAWADGRGYAFVTFATELKAEEALKQFSSQTLECRRCIWDVKGGATTKDDADVLRRLPLHECEIDMPTLSSQLSPLSETQLRLRLKSLGRPSSPSSERQAYSKGGRIAKKNYLLDQLSRCYTEGGAERVVTRVEAGVSLPGDRIAEIVEALRNADFGKKGGGKSRNVSAKKYTVLGRASSDAPHKVSKSNSHLWSLALSLLRCFYPDSSFNCTSLAVTKNFIGSPHLDIKDTSFQYAASFGTLEDGEGGELCIENSEGNEIFVVSTLNKIVKVDGRFIHWVKSYPANRERFRYV